MLCLLQRFCLADDLSSTDSQRHVLFASSSSIDHVHPLLVMARRTSNLVRTTVHLYFASELDWFVIEAGDRLISSNNHSSMFRSFRYPNLELISLPSGEKFQSKPIDSYGGPLLPLDDLHERLHHDHETLFQSAVSTLVDQYSIDLRYDVAVGIFFNFFQSHPFWARSLTTGLGGCSTRFRCNHHLPPGPRPSMSSS